MTNITNRKFLASGYSVIFLHRMYSQRPYTHSFPSDMLFEAVTVNSNNTLSLNEKVRDDAIAAISAQKQVSSHHLISLDPGSSGGFIM